MRYWTSEGLVAAFSPFSSAWASAGAPPKNPRCYGHRRVQFMLRREGWVINEKRSRLTGCRARCDPEWRCRTAVSTTKGAKFADGRITSLLAPYEELLWP